MAKSLALEAFYILYLIVSSLMAESLASMAESLASMAESLASMAESLASVAELLASMAESLAPVADLFISGDCGTSILYTLMYRRTAHVGP